MPRPRSPPGSGTPPRRGPSGRPGEGRGACASRHARRGHASNLPVSSRLALCLPRLPGRS
jgi:hypothetical protein